MVAIAWDPTLALGHAEIDAQHQEIFRRFGALVAAMEAGDPGDVRALFEFLASYAARHFAAEEHVMAQVRYPGVNVHAAAHARFVRELADLRALYDGSGASSGVVVKTRTWIEDWLRAHIMGVDMGLARYLLGR